MMNCIAVDDEKLVLDLLVDNIRKVPFLNLVARCKNAIEATEALHREKVDLIFLDIQMPGINGLDFIRSLTKPPLIILVTAYKDYALEGFAVNAVDYLLKPVPFDRFLKASNKAYDLFNLQQKGEPVTELPGYFFVYVEYNQVKVTIDEILYVEGMKDYVKMYISSSKKPVITKISLKAIEEKLIPYKFLRIHKSYIIPIHKVTAIKRDLAVIGEYELPIGESYRQQLDQLLQR